MNHSYEPYSCSDIFGRRFNGITNIVCMTDGHYSNTQTLNKVEEIIIPILYFSSSILELNLNLSQVGNIEWFIH